MAPPASRSETRRVLSLVDAIGPKRRIRPGGVGPWGDNVNLTRTCVLSGATALAGGLTSTKKPSTVHHEAWARIDRSPKPTTMASADAGCRLAAAHTAEDC